MSEIPAQQPAAQQPYAYSVPDYDQTYVYPSIAAYLAVARKDGAPARAFKRTEPVQITAHYVDGTTAQVPVSADDQIVELPVNRAGIEREVDERRAESLRTFTEQLKRLGSFTGSQPYCYGDRDEQIEDEVLRRRWQWKDEATAPASVAPAATT